MQHLYSNNSIIFEHFKKVIEYFENFKNGFKL
jgi:hypothetical protein